MDYKTKPGSPEEVLEHFGTRGMKWGVRRSQHSMNKASRQRDRAARNASIDQARARVASGQVRREYKAAKAKYKRDRQIVGRREARKTLNSTRSKLNSEYRLSQQAKHGSETVTTVMALAGATVLSGAGAAAAARRL